MRSRVAATVVILALLASSLAFVAAQLAVAPPEPSAAPGPTASPTLPLSIITSRYGYLSVLTAAGATCAAQVRLPSGRAVSTRGRKTADASGNVSWTYSTTQTQAGSGTHTVTCELGGESRTASATYTVP